MSKYSDDGYQMALRRRSSPWPYYIAGGVWLLYAAVFPMYRIWDFLIAAALTAAVFFAAKRWIFRSYDTWVKVKEAEIDTGDKTADDMLREGSEFLRRLRSGRGEIENLIVRDKLSRIIAAVEGIFAHIRENPRKAVRISNFVNYYLPMVVKLTEKYAELGRQSIKSENIDQSISDIGGILDTVERAFRKQLDALYDDTVLDIITDVQVLEKMLAGEGLSGGIYSNDDNK